MKNISYILACATLLTLLPSAGEAVEKGRHQHLIASRERFAEPKVRVLLQRDVDSALIEVIGKYKVLHAKTDALLSFGLSGKRFIMMGLQEGLRWGEEYPDVYQVRLIPQSRETMFFVNGIQYQGALTVLQNRKNKITVINEIVIEDFLRSTLSLQVEGNFSSETLAAVAIAARSEVLHRIQTASERKYPWDFDANESGYFGYATVMSNKAVEKALKATHHMVLCAGEKAVAAQWSNKPTQQQARILVAAQAEDLVKRGFDAKRILSVAFPEATIALLPHKKS